MAKLAGRTFQNICEPGNRRQVRAHPYELNFLGAGIVLQGSQMIDVRIFCESHGAMSSWCLAVSWICVVEAFTVMLQVGIEELQDGCKWRDADATAN